MSSDRRFLWIVIAVLFVVTSVPYIVGFFLVPPGRAFSGAHYQNAGDWNVYYSYIEQVRQGSPTVANTFSTQDDRPVLVMPVFLASGLLARLTGLPTPVAYHLVRLALLPLVVFAFAKVARHYSDAEGWRWSVVVFLFAGGFGWAAEKTDLIPFLGLLFSPHYAAAWLFYLWILLLIPAVAAQRPAAITWLALAETLLLLTIPFAGVIGGLTIVLGLGFFSRAWRACLEVFALLVPVIIYQGFLSVNSPDIQSYLHQNVTRTPDAGEFVLGLGFIWFFVLIGLRRWREHLLPVVIAGLALAASLLPFSFQQRFLFGVPVAVALAAGAGLGQLQRWVERRWRGSTAALAVVAILALWWSALSMVLKTAVSAATYSLSADEASVARWIKATTGSRDHVFTDLRQGNIIAGQTGRTVFLGHRMQTPGAFTREAKVHEFYQGRLPMSDARRLFDEAGITYAVIPQTATIVPAASPESFQYGEIRFNRVLTTATLAIYAVEL